MNSLENKFPFSTFKMAISAAMLAISPSFLYAAEIAGRVNFVSGTAFVNNSQNQQRSVFKGDLVYAGERIDTSSNSRIQIKMTDGGTIVLRPNSSFEITKYTFSKDTPELGAVLFNFIKGGARAVSGAIGKVNRENYKFNTAVATIGIRGTDYSAALENDKLTVSVNDGKVNIANTQGNQEANEGETFVTSANSKPSLCHHVNGSTNNCNPVFISLDADDNVSFSKQKIKKPTLENYASYGAFVEAVRRYKSLEQEIERLETNEQKLAQQDNPIVIISPASPSRLSNIQLRLDRLENNELGDISVANAIGIIDIINQDENLGLTQDIHEDDMLIRKVFKYKIEEATEEKKTTKYVFDLTNFIDFQGFIENLFLLNTDTLYGNNMRMTGVEVGNPKINVTLGASLFDALNVELSAATRNRNYIVNLGLNSDSIHNILDTNNNNNYGGLLSIKQISIYDRDGLAGQKGSGGFIQIGNGSAKDATVVLTDDNTPIRAALDLVDVIRANTNDFFDFSELSNKAVINIDLNTPKLLVKLGSVYIGGFRTIANQDTDGTISLENVSDANLNSQSAVKILEPALLVLGEASIKARLEHTPHRIAHNIDGLNVNPTLSIFADASIKSGISIYNFELIDVGGSIRGGRIAFDRLNIIDSVGSNLTAKLAVYIETNLDLVNSKLRLFGGDIDGLVISLDQLGHVDQGIDVAVSNVRVGSQFSKSIGDVQIKGLNINGSRLILRGH